MRAAWLAVGLVLIANAIEIIPAERERANPVGEFTLAVCRDQVVGGWRDGELPMLQLPLSWRMNGLGELLDDNALAALGFSVKARATLGDTTRGDLDWSSQRMAWLSLRQQPDSFRMLEVLRVASTREVLAPVPGELAIRGLIGLEWVQEVPPHGADSATVVAFSQRSPQIGVGVKRLLPRQLGVDREQAAALSVLRNDERRPCGATVPVTLLMGKRGAVWARPAP